MGWTPDAFSHISCWWVECTALLDQLRSQLVISVEFLYFFSSFQQAACWDGLVLLCGISPLPLLLIYFAGCQVVQY